MNINTTSPTQGTMDFATQQAHDGSPTTTHSVTTTALQFLNLSNTINTISAEGEATLAQMKPLISLDLSENTIGDSGAAALAESETLKPLSPADIEKAFSRALKP